MFSGSDTTQPRLVTVGLVIPLSAASCPIRFYLAVHTARALGIVTANFRPRRVDIIVHLGLTCRAVLCDPSNIQTGLFEARQVQKRLMGNKESKVAKLVWLPRSHGRVTWVRDGKALSVATAKHHLEKRRSISAVLCEYLADGTTAAEKVIKMCALWSKTGVRV